MRLIRDVLDNGVINHEGRKLGRVDGLVIELREDQPPRLAFIEVGAPVLASRLNPRLGDLVAKFWDRFQDKRGKVTRIHWFKVRKVGIDVEVEMSAFEQKEILAWEDWVRVHITDNIPGRPLMAQEIHLELLVGKLVRDNSGKAVGRLEEVIAEKQGDNWIINEFHVGEIAAAERMAAGRIRNWLALRFGSKGGGGYRIPWQELDLSDPLHPQLHCGVGKLQPLESYDDGAEGKSFD